MRLVAPMECSFLFRKSIDFKFDIPPITLKCPCPECSQLRAVAEKNRRYSISYLINLKNILNAHDDVRLDLLLTVDLDNSPSKTFSM